MGLAFAALGFVVVNAVLSFLTFLLWVAVRRTEPRANTIFVLRLMPAIGSVLIVWGLVMPAFWSFEPSATNEQAGPALAAMFVVACALLLAGLYRALVSLLRTRRLERLWTAAAGRASAEIPVPVYRVSSAMPFAALVGIVRPRIYVADRFLDALEPGERLAVMAHEAAHRDALDNLKRIAMKLAPDWLALFPAGRQLESAWAIAAEDDADDRAAAPGGARPLDLAGALLKAARLVPRSCAPASSFCEGTTIARRVTRLLDDQPSRRRPPYAHLARFAVVLALIAVAAFVAGPAVRAAYTMTEAGVRLLQ
jgi:Zn-dependent protease with chaperone function